MSNTLLPCPFCGDKATISDGGYSGEKFFAHCRDLSCPGASGFIRKTHDEAIAAWNRRAQPENEQFVRCENCSHWDKTVSFMSANACAFWSGSKRSPRYTESFDFCSFAEPKPGEEV